MLVLLGLLPAATCLLVGYTLRPAGPVFAPVRLALVRAAVLVGAVAAVLVEVLGAARALTLPVLTVTWSVAVLLALAGAILRYRRERRLPDPRVRLRAAWATAGRPERIMAIALLGLLAAELLIALVSPPNNYDSQTYHLPKIEHWVQQRDVDFYATRIHRQLSIAPGAEYLLLHLRLLTGGDALYNLLQFSAGVGCVLLAARIAGQLGGSPRAQLLAAFVVGTTPIIALESTSTQTDLVVAAWVACVATLVLDELRRRTPLANLALLGAATGLTTLTKATGLLAAGPLLLIWGVAQLRLSGVRGLLRTAAGSVLIIGLAAAIAGPYLHRVDAEYGNPLGPDYLRNSISMQRHDPPSILVNALRIGHTALNTPIAPVNNAAARGIERLSRAMGVNPNDSKITFWGSTFPATAWVPDEDRASFPVEGVLVLLGAGFLLVRPGRRVPARYAVAARAYAAAFWLALICYVATVKWQPWGNRLILYVLVLGAPLAGLWLDAVLRRDRSPGRAREGTGPDGAQPPDSEPAPTEPAPTEPAPTGPGTRRAAAAWVAVAALVVSGCAGWLAVGYGWPRRLVGTGSVFTVDDLQARFQRRPQWQADYEWAAAAVRASGARKVGLVQGDDTWEYPWWVLLRGDDIESMQSLQPDLPATQRGQVDALVCVSTAPVCAYYAPGNWQVHMRGDIGYALPPGR